MFKLINNCWKRLRIKTMSSGPIDSTTSLWVKLEITITIIMLVLIIGVLMWK